VKKIRLGIAGLGQMGANHAAAVAGGKIPGLELSAVADVDSKRLAQWLPARGFSSAEAMIESGAIEAILIATPHFDHTAIGVAALQAGLHVLVEKPISVHKAEAERLVAAHRAHPQLVFAAMFNQRSDPHFRKLRELLQSGELGELRRVNWTVTDWYRTQCYYAQGGWRATWAGEGGGVLLNQCVHNLDLLQWLFGQPTRVRAHCGFGRYHDIEVEDDVTAYLEFPNGATGVFIASTGETPGTNRLEIVAERAKVVYEANRISYVRNEVPMTEFARAATQPFARPPMTDVAVATLDHGGQHAEILRNFGEAILERAPLIAPAAEGIHSVELANAMLMSAWTGETIDLPIDARRYEILLAQKIAASPRTRANPVPCGAKTSPPATRLARQETDLRS
jgi:predicted dehydrogenase